MLLALLGANDALGRPDVHRTVLVKQAFLAETVRPLYRQWRQTFAFVRYHFGPYSDDIFRRLNVLIFHGLVEVTMVDHRGGRVEAKYRISQGGHEIVRQVIPSEIMELATDLVWALQSLGVSTAGAICKLVYQEAEFARIFGEHSEAGIGPESKVPLPSITSANNQTFLILAILHEFQRRQAQPEQPNHTFSLESREVLRVFLQHLANAIPRAMATS